MKAKYLRKSSIKKGIPLHYVDIDEGHVTFRGKFPSVLNIPNVMREYPGYTHSIISWKEFSEKYGEE